MTLEPDPHPALEAAEPDADAQPALDAAEVSGTIADILAVIESAKARGGLEALEGFIAKNIREAEEDEVREAAEVAVEVIESIPVFLARARQEGEERGLSSVVDPLLNRAEA